MNAEPRKTGAWPVSACLKSALAKNRTPSAFLRLSHLAVMREHVNE
jgi:hypothetical protein